MEALTPLGDAVGAVGGVGGRPRVPVAFGEYEVGRTSMPWVRNMPSAWSLDGRNKLPKPDPTNDPGHYDPYAYGWFSDNRRIHGYNKKRPGFDSSEVRRLRHRMLGLESGNLVYNVGEAEKTLYPTIDANVSVFRSGSTQRPSSKSDTPGPAAYVPNDNSVEPNVGYANPGYHMRSNADRFGNFKAGVPGTKSMTDRGVGPATYDCHEDRSLSFDVREAMKRGSKLRPAFNTTTPQRNPHIYGNRTGPGPGTYQRLAPRVRDLKAGRGIPAHARV